MNNDLPVVQGSPDREPGAAKLDTVEAVGARLAQLRTERGMSVSDVSARLKVSVAKLKALEAGDLSLLPDATFALGIVRSYAKMLGANSDAMLPALRVAYGANAPDLSMPASSGASLPRGKMDVNWRTPAPRRAGWIWALAVVVVVAVLLLVWRDGREPSAWLARFKPHGAATSTAASTDNGASPEAAPASAASGETAGDAPAPAVLADNRGAPAAGAGGTTGASAAAAATPPTVAPLSTGTDAASGALASEAAAAPAGTSTLIFTLTQDSWVSVRDAGGREVFSGVLHSGDSAPIQGKRPFKIVIGNEHGVDALQLDAQPVDMKAYLSTKGNVARFTLP